MLPEIGVMAGLYILVRLIPERWRWVSRVLSVLAAAATLFVVADLIARGTLERGLLAQTAEPPAGFTPPAKTPATVTRADGGSITTELGYGIAVAKGSTLHREFIAVHDPAMPVDLEGTPGVVTAYVAARNQYATGDYRYKAKFTVTPREPVRAIEVRFIAFDVWGLDSRRLNFQEVRDLEAGQQATFDGEWSLYSENDVETHYASIAYVSRVRLADGRVLVADPSPVIAEARKFNAKFSAEQLEPEPRTPAKP